MTALYVLLGIIAGWQIDKLDSERDYAKGALIWVKFCGAVLTILIIAGIQWANA